MPTSRSVTVIYSIFLYAFLAIGGNVASADTLMGGAIQGMSLNLTNSVTTLVGDTTDVTSSLNYPQGIITTDGQNLYVADMANSIIRQIVIATGAVTTVAGSTSGYLDGNGTNSRFNRPQGITTDGAYLYVADTANSVIRKIAIATGEVTTLAGTSGLAGQVDAQGITASFRSPRGITTDGTSLYVADSGNSTIRQIVISTGVVTTLAGTVGKKGFTDGVGIDATFNGPIGITTDNINLYVTDTTNSTIRKIVIATGVVTTLAGTAGSPGNTDAIGMAASFTGPFGITTDGTNLYVADTFNSTIRKVVISSGTVTTLAGLAGATGKTDGKGASARFYRPASITTNGKHLFLSDTGNNLIREIH